jgi:hypothetical protein
VPILVPTLPPRTARLSLGFLELLCCWRKLSRSSGSIKWDRRPIGRIVGSPAFTHSITVLYPTPVKSATSRIFSN